MAANETNSTSTQRQPWSFKSKVLAVCAVVLSIVALVAGVRLTVAAFSANDYLKAVAATNEAANLLSSDQLTGFTTSSPGDDLIPRKSIVVNPDEDSTKPASFSFNIFNYLQNDPTIWCQKNIVYDTTVYVANSTNPGACELNGKQFTESADNVWSAKLEGQTLNGRQMSKLAYTVSFPQADINAATFQVRVNVTDAGGTMIRSMAADITPNLKAEVQDVAWEIKSADGAEADLANIFDAYNYDITVQGARTEVSFTWNNEKVQIDPYFAEKTGAAVGESEGTPYATLTMDPGTLRVNFYRLDGDAIHEDTKLSDLGVRKK